MRIDEYQKTRWVCSFMTLLRTTFCWPLTLLGEKESLFGSLLQLMNWCFATYVWDLLRKGLSWTFSPRFAGGRCTYWLRPKFVRSCGHPKRFFARLFSSQLRDDPVRRAVNEDGKSAATRFEAGQTHLQMHVAKKLQGKRKTMVLHGFTMFYSGNSGFPFFLKFLFPYVKHPAWKQVLGKGTDGALLLVTLPCCCSLKHFVLQRNLQYIK